MAEEQNVQAEQQAVDQQAEKMAAKVIQEAQTEQPTGEQQQEAPSTTPQPDMQAVLRDELGKFRGGFADTFGRKTIEMEQRISDKVDAVLQPVLTRIQQDEEARIGQLLPEEQTEYWKARATEPVQQEPQPQNNPQQANLENLATEAQGLITKSGGSTHLNDPVLWQGWHDRMSNYEALKLAETNLQKMGSPQPVQAQQAPQTAQAAPTTQGAPQKTARSVNTLSEAATLFADGNIDSNQYRNIKAEIAKGGSATL